jgi:hypothetical protein
LPISFASSGIIPIVPLGYQGPGDIVPGAIAWWGLRAYSHAACGSNCCDIKRASDNAVQTFVTLSDGSVDLPSITTFLAATTGQILKLYDQSGALAMTGGTPADLSSTLGPLFIFNAIGSLPGFDGSQILSTGTNFLVTTRAQPYTMSAVAKRTSGGQSTIASYNDQPTQLLFNTAANSIGMYNGGAIPAIAAADGSPHAIHGVCNNAVQSIMFIDSVSNNVTVGAASLASGNIFAFPSTSSGALTGVLWESGFWPVGFSGGQLASMDSNQRTYWGF